MKAAFLNSVTALALVFTLLAGSEGQQNQSPAQPSQPPADTQPQSEPPQPTQAAPQPESPKEQPQTQSPTPSPQSETVQPSQAVPDQEQPKHEPPQPSQQAPQATPPVEAPVSSTSKAKARTPSKSKPAINKNTTAGSKTQSATQSGKVVVRNGGARESTAQISPGVNDQQAQHQRDATHQLLATTDANVKKVSGKQLTSAQQGMLEQVNSYVRQSKAASDAGDISRAHTLAVKAQLLSNELARR